MEKGPPGYWTYALATGAAAVLAICVSTTFGITGRLDVAVMIVALSTVSYLVTPAALRGQATRVFGIAGLALASLVAGSAVGALFGGGLAAPLMLAGDEPPQLGADLVVLAVAVLAAGAGYLGFFRTFFHYVAPRPEIAEEAAAPARPKFL